MKTYCNRCGSKLVDVECNYYDEHTGEKVHDLVCPKEGCEKHCDFFGHVYIRRWWWASDMKCGLCGYVPYDGY